MVEVSYCGLSVMRDGLCSSYTPKKVVLVFASVLLSLASACVQRVFAVVAVLTTCSAVALIALRSATTKKLERSRHDAANLSADPGGRRDSQ